MANPNTPLVSLSAFPEPSWCFCHFRYKRFNEGAWDGHKSIEIGFSCSFSWVCLGFVFQFWLIFSKYVYCMRWGKCLLFLSSYMLSLVFWGLRWLNFFDMLSDYSLWIYFFKEPFYHQIFFEALLLVMVSVHLNIIYLLFNYRYDCPNIPQ